MTRITGFQRVASAYDATEINLAVTALEGAGYIAITPGLILNHMAPQRSFAFGPIAILVPQADAESARAFLRAIHAGTMTVLDDRHVDPEENEAEEPEDEGRDPPATRTIWRKLLDALGFALAGVSHPRDRLSIDTPPPRVPDR